MENLKLFQHEPEMIGDYRFSESSEEERDPHIKPSKVTDNNRAGREDFWQFGDNLFTYVSQSY